MDAPLTALRPGTPVRLPDGTHATIAALEIGGATYAVDVAGTLHRGWRREQLVVDVAVTLGRVDGTVDATLGRTCDPTGAFIRRAGLAESDFDVFTAAYLERYAAQCEADRRRTVAL